jgi:hypothetical protein
LDNDPYTDEKLGQRAIEVARNLPFYCCNNKLVSLKMNATENDAVNFSLWHHPYNPKDT